MSINQLAQTNMLNEAKIGTSEAVNFDNSPLPTTTPTTGIFQISLNHTIVNKPPKDSNAMSTARYSTHAVTIRSLMKHVVGDGKMFAIGVYRGNHRHENDFISSQIICLDFDQLKDKDGNRIGGHTSDELLTDSLIARYGSFYATASYTDTAPCHRVIFVLEEPITDVKRYRDLVARLIADMKAKFNCIDPNTRDGARNWYGHKIAPENEGKLYRVNEARLPIATLEALPAVSHDSIGSGEKRMGKITIPTQDLILADDQFNEMVQSLPRFVRRRVKVFIGITDNRNPALYSVARKLNDCVGKEDGKGLITKDTAYRLLYTCAVKNGYISAKGEFAFNVTFKSAFKNVPSPLEKEADFITLNDTATANDFLQGETFTMSQHYVNGVKVSELDFILSKRLVMIKSATGTGKTEFIKTVVAWWAKRLPVTPRVLVVTYRQKLVFQNAERLGYHSYQDANTYAESTVTTLDSLHKFAGQKYDIIVMDEFTQCLDHLVSSATLHEDRITALQTLEALMKSARLTLAMDANATDTAAKILEGMNSAHFKSNIRVFNTHLPKNRQLDIYAHRSAFLARVMESANEGFTTLATVSIRHAEIADSIARGMGLKTLVVTSHTSAQVDVVEAVNNINTVQGIDLVIYTHSMGVGVSIDRPVNGAFLWACTRPLTAHDHVQMLSRARNAKVYVAHGVRLPSDADIENEKEAQALTPSAQVVYGDIINVVTGVNGRLPQDEDGAFQRSAMMWARLKADEFKLNCDPLGFVRACLANGFKFHTMHTDENDFMARLIASESKAHDEAVKDLTITSPAVSDEELEELRQNGQMSRVARAGNVRFKIERMVGEPITECLYDKLGTATKRAKIRRLADVLADSDMVKQADHAMNLDRAWQDYTPRHAQYKIFWRVMSAMGMSRIDDLKGIVGKPKEEIVTPMVERVFDHNEADIRKAFKRYEHAQTENAFTELKWLLRQFSITFTTPSQVMRDGVRFYTYSIDLSALDESIALAEKVLALAITQFREKTISSRNQVTTPHHTQPHDTLPIGGVQMTLDEPIKKRLAGL